MSLRFNFSVRRSLFSRVIPVPAHRNPQPPNHLRSLPQKLPPTGSATGSPSVPSPRPRIEIPFKGFSNAPDILPSPPQSSTSPTAAYTSASPLRLRPQYLHLPLVRLNPQPRPRELHRIRRRRANDLPFLIYPTSGSPTVQSDLTRRRFLIAWRADQCELVSITNHPNVEINYRNVHA